MELDPDYAFDVSQDSVEEYDITRQLENHAREAVKEKIRAIIKKQFSEEINAKEKEVALITERLTDARHMLDRLRACVVASYYASSFAKPQDKHMVESGAAHHPAIQNILRKAATAVLSRNAPHEQSKAIKDNESDNADSIVDSDSEKVCSETREIDGVSKISESEAMDDDHVVKSLPPSFSEMPIGENLGGRHRIKKRIIVGNVSKYIPPDKREGNDNSSHKWMVYVRGSAEEPRIDHFVRKVWFFLHPSYRPNDLVEITEAPFHLTRRGWGEFPIRVQLHFCDPRNRRVDIIHNLSLDRTYTGLQTLGSETVCEVELDRSTIGLPVENLLHQSVTPPTSQSGNTGKLPFDGKSLINDADTKFNIFDSKSSVYNLIREMVATVEKKLTNDIKEEKMDVDSSVDDDDDEEDQDICSPTAERRRRRRRGDSCTVIDPKEDAKLKQDSTSMMLLCSGGQAIDEENSGSKVVIAPDGSELDAEQILIDEKSQYVKKEESSAYPTQTRCSQPSSTSRNIIITSQSVPSSPTEFLSSKSSSSTPPATKSSSIVDRPRSLSVDDITPTLPSSASLSVSGGKLIQVNKPVSVKEPVKMVSSTPANKVFSSPIVLYRPRSSSTGFTQKFAQTSKGNVTILTPIPSKTVSSKLVGQKRNITSVSPNASGKLLYSLVPEKQRKLASSAKTSDVTVTRSKPPIMSHESKPSSSWTLSSGKITLTLAGAKQQVPVVLNSGDSSLLPGTSGAALVSSSKVKVETNPMPSKPFVLRCSKQGQYVVGQSSQVKEPSKASQTNNPSTLTASSTDKPEDNQMKKPVDVKPGNQQHLLSMKALKNAIMNSGMSLNRPVQIQIEKPGNIHQSFGQLKNNQQFVLTTITNEQGKQQLALVSTDKLKQLSKTKSLSSGSFSSAQESSDLPIPVNFEWINQSNSSCLVTKFNDAENLSFAQIVGKRIVQHSINDIVADALPLAVKYVPLVASDRNTSFLPFCARTEAEFLDWNIGKQRASELQRASLLQKILKYVANNSSSCNNLSVPSKRFIINWCLTRGHSIFTDEFEAIETTTAQDDTSKVKVESSLTSCDQLLNKLILDSSKSQQTKIFGSDQVDVVTVTSPRRSIKTEPRTNEVAYSSPLLFIHSNEMKAVNKMSQDIDIKLRDVPVCDDVKAPLCHVILAKALQLFTSDLTRLALATSLTRRDGKNRILRVLPEKVECRDVAEAVINENRFQIISDQCMGMTRDLS